MLELRESTKDEIEQFVQMEQSEDTARHVIPWSVEKHLSEMQNESIVYLSIYVDRILSGFIILFLEEAGVIEFRRIVISSKGKGLGQRAIKQMEKYCIEELKGSKVWLDVFESNHRGRHIYNKLGYRQFKIGSHEGRTLIFMEKPLFLTS